jgi:hypothetical protein
MHWASEQAVPSAGSGRVRLACLAVFCRVARPPSTNPEIAARGCVRASDSDGLEGGLAAWVCACIPNETPVQPIASGCDQFRCGLNCARFLLATTKPVPTLPVTRKPARACTRRSREQ